ncbi:DUF3027 domain-containing protein [Kineococcus sp. R8]|uniref:DUF3027 domain-containing protein n=1 Tax=Kineococcus siccus TaxID=2696567 RepID=UPI0014130FE7|nr:DUF3027 domain-containing protein [Kineococcus siccus]
MSETTSATRARRARKPVLDSVSAAALDLARAAAEEVAEPGTVGEHLGVTAEGDRIVTHAFAATLPGYRGWQWSVTVSRASRAKNVTVSEVCLLPGDGALRPPVWLPWSERIAPGDLGTQDTLPRKADDPLLEPGYEATGDEEADRLALWELGLGRERVLSLLGRDEAATRWYAGDRGPRAEIAEHAKAPCSTCGFFLLLAGSLRQVFGVCASEWSPEDGRVVSADHGCGAHSETDVESEVEAPSAPLIDDLAPDGLELIRTGGTDVDEAPADEGPVEAAEAAASDGAEPDAPATPAD